MSAFSPPSHIALGLGVEAMRRDQLVLIEGGFVYAGRWMQTDTARFSAGIVLTVHGEDSFEFGAPGLDWQRCAALVTRPHARRRLRVRDVPAVSIGVSPNHPSYRLFRGIEGAGSIGLPRALFAPLDAQLQAVYDGSSSLDDVRVLLQQVVDVLLPRMPVHRQAARDPRIGRVLRMLHAEPTAGLDALAEASGLSYDRMSHLFSQEVGLPLRSFQLAQKIHLATQLVGSGLSLTGIALAAGFVDSAHFSKVWLKAYGGPPTHFFCNERVEVRSAFGGLPRAA